MLDLVPAVRRPDVRGALLCVGLLAAPAVASADADAYFRLFLRDGTMVACLAEYARVDDRVVCSMPLGGPEESELVSIPESRVDWPRTDEYSAALRAERYAATRGEHDFAVLSGEVAGMLNEITFTRDNAQRLAIALEARRRLSEWPREHHNYRTGDVQQILQLVDEAISDFRAAAGAQEFDLNFVANTVPSRPVALLAPPTADESLTAALALAEAAAEPAERMSLLEAVQRSLARDGTRVSASVRQRLEPRVTARLDRERKIDAGYARLAADAVGQARASAARADVRGVERVLARVRERDKTMGRHRPRHAAAILAMIQDELDAARRLRLARDRWALTRTAVRSYQRLVRQPIAELDLMARGLDDIKRLAGPASPVLAQLARRAAAASRKLGEVVPPADLAAVHGLLVSAAQLAAQAVLVRQDAVRSGAIDRAWQASSAAAGAIMLLGRARAEMAQALVPPRL